MPPRLPALAVHRQPTASAVLSLASFLVPFMQGRAASILASLSDTPGAYHKHIRRGRGPSSGKGKTSGRGHKGQKAHGSVHPRFQGGQTPQVGVHGTVGFENQFSVHMSPVNLDRIQSWIDQGRLDPSQPITLKELVQSRCIHGIKDGVKLLARGKEELRTPIDILVSRASAEAIKAIEDIGGKVTTRFYTKTSIRRILRGESESSPLPLAARTEDGSPILSDLAASGKAFKYRIPDPTSRKDLEYYRDASHRGYLSHLVEEGHGPSLFFKKPASSRRRKMVTKASGGKVVVESKMW